jgi:hypothetical protein
MVKPPYMASVALLFLIVLAAPAAAQTTATSGGVAGTSLANPYGAVTLPGATRPVTAAAGQSGSTAGTSPAGGSGAGAGAGPGASAATGSSVRQGSGGSSATGTATGSKSVPGWLLCAPPGATGMAPFVTGTDLSCAP